MWGGVESVHEEELEDHVDDEDAVDEAIEDKEALNWRDRRRQKALCERGVCVIDVGMV